MNVTRPFWWKVNIGSGNGLMATNHYLSQWWPRSLSTCGVTRPNELRWYTTYVQYSKCDVGRSLNIEKSLHIVSRWASYRAPRANTSWKWQFQCTILLQTYVPYNRKPRMLIQIHMKGLTTVANINVMLVFTLQISVMHGNLNLHRFWWRSHTLEWWQD